jgi:hypothetical protein
VRYWRKLGTVLLVLFVAAGLCALLANPPSLMIDATDVGAANREVLRAHVEIAAKCGSSYYYAPYFDKPASANSRSILTYTHIIRVGQLYQARNLENDRFLQIVVKKTVLGWRHTWHMVSLEDYQSATGRGVYTTYGVFPPPSKPLVDPD